MAEAKIRIGADHRPLDNAIGRVKQSFKGLGSTLKSIVGSPLTAIFGALSFARAVSEVKKLTDALNTIGKGASRLSVTTAEFQELEYAAKRSGAEMSNIETAFKTMSGKVFEAKNGMASAKQEIAALGLSLADLEGKSRLEQFKLISQALSEIKDPGDRAALAVKMFGKAGEDLLPMIGTINQLGGEFRELGATIEDSAVKAAEKLQDELLNLGTQLKAIVAGSGLIEWLAGVAEGINEVQKARVKLEKGEVKALGGAKVPGVKEVAAEFLTNLNPVTFVARKLFEKGREVIQPTELSTAPQTREDVTAARKALADDKAAAAAREKAREDAATAAAREATGKAIDAELTAQFGEVDKLAAAYQRTVSVIDAQIAAMKDATAVQALINEGKDEEAAKLEKVLALQRQIGRELTAQERAAVEAAAGAVFKARQKKINDVVEEPEDSVRMGQQQIFAGGVAAIGGGGAKMLDLAASQLDYTRINLLREMNKHLQAIEEKANPAPQDERFV